jgi:hypothetical protein
MSKSGNLSKEEAWTPKSKTYKKMNSLTRNVQYWGDKLGVDNLGFMTLTFKGNLKDPKEAQRRWNNLSRTLSRDGKMHVCVKVVEVQNRGAIHYHCLVHIGEDIRTGFDWEAFKRAGQAYGARDRVEGRKQTKIYASSAKKHLRHLWGYMRTKCESHGFGRSELMPIHYPNNIGSYLGKYLNKDDEKREKKHYDPWTTKVRKIAYGRKLPKVASANFSWVKRPDGQKTWREKLRDWAEYRGFKDMDDLRARLGRNWSHHYYHEITFDHVRFQRAAAGYPAIGETKDPYWYVPNQESWDNYLVSDKLEKTDRTKRKAVEKNRFLHFKNRKKFAHLWD